MERRIHNINLQQEIKSSLAAFLPIMTPSILIDSPNLL